MDSTALMDIDIIIKRLEAKREIWGGLRREDLKEMEDILGKLDVTAEIMPEHVEEIRGMMASLLLGEPLLLSSNKTPRGNKPRKLILKNGQCPGDIVMLTATVRDLHDSHPNKFITDVRTPCPAIWENNPHITKLDENDPEVEVINMEYPLIHDSNEGQHHFIHGFRMFLEEKLGIVIKAGAFKGDIHLSEQEKSWIPQVENTRYWVLVAGGKKDYTNKWWAWHRYQEVVNKLRGSVLLVQVGEMGSGHVHADLNGVMDLRGKTNIRQLIRLIYHSSGVITPVSLMMHLASAIETRSERCLKNRPCVVIAGGREPSQWEAYPNHQYLHTCGQLACCDNGGCWRSRVEPLMDGETHDHNLCTNVVQINKKGQMKIPRCMHMITSDDVVRHVLEYEGGFKKYEG